MLKRMTPVAAVLLMVAVVHAESLKPSDLVQASLIADVDAITPGSPFTLAVRLKMAPHWHTYWVNPGETGNATTIKFSGPKGLEFGEIQWPLPTRLVADGSIVYGYENETLLMVPVKVAKEFSSTPPVRIHADVAWLSCKDTCIEGGAKLDITLPVSLNSKPANSELFTHWRERLPSARKSVSDVLFTTKQDGAAPAITVQWHSAPNNVEFFPISSDSVTIENVVVKTTGQSSEISFKTNVYKPAAIPGRTIEGLLVFENAQGRRVGVKIPIRVVK